MLFCDNIVAIYSNSVQYNRTNYIKVDKNYRKDNLNSSIIEFFYIKRIDQLVDVMTHAVTFISFHIYFCDFVQVRHM